MWSGVGFVDKAYSGVYQSYKLADYLVAWRALEMHRQTCSFAGGYLGVVQMAVSIISSLQSPSGVSGLGVNYPALTDGALGFPVAFTTHLHLPFRVFTHPRPVPLVKARAMFSVVLIQVTVVYHTTLRTVIFSSFNVGNIPTLVTGAFRERPQSF